MNSELKTKIVILPIVFQWLCIFFYLTTVALDSVVLAALLIGSLVPNLLVAIPAASKENLGPLLQLAIVPLILSNLVGVAYWVAVSGDLILYGQDPKTDGMFSIFWLAILPATWIVGAALGLLALIFRYGLNRHK